MGGCGDQSLPVTAKQRLTSPTQQRLQFVWDEGHLWLGAAVVARVERRSYADTESNRRAECVSVLPSDGTAHAIIERPPVVNTERAPL